MKICCCSEGLSNDQESARFPKALCRWIHVLREVLFLYDFHQKVKVSVFRTGFLIYIYTVLKSHKKMVKLANLITIYKSY